MPLTDIDGQRLGDSVADKLGNRNLLINGAMQVRQRSDSTGVTTSEYVLDRFQFIINTMGTFSLSQSTEAPDGFSSSLKVDCTTADASPGSSDFILLGQKIEGQNLQHLDFGSSSAKQLTYSFWVRSAKTGTHVLEFFQDGNSRQVSATYTVSAANTWEHKEVTIDGDTASALANDTSSELAVYHWLGGGSNFTSGTLNTSGFAAVTNANRAPGTINIADSTSNEFYLTGAQLEVGNTATPFEHRSFADELARCERYFEVITGRTESFMGYSFTTALANCPIRFRTPKRAAPGTITLGTAGNSAGTIAFLTAAGAYPSTVGSHTATVATTEGFRFQGTGYSGLTDDRISPLYANTETVIAKVDAEL